jgi:hypothetical protein
LLLIFSPYSIGMNNILDITDLSSGSQLKQFDQDKQKIIVDRVKSGPIEYEHMSNEKLEEIAKAKLNLC